MMDVLIMIRQLDYVKNVKVENIYLKIMVIQMILLYV